MGWSDMIWRQDTKKYFQQCPLDHKSHSSKSDFRTYNLSGTTSWLTWRSKERTYGGHERRNERGSENCRQHGVLLDTRRSATATAREMQRPPNDERTICCWNRQQLTDVAMSFSIWLCNKMVKSSLIILCVCVCVCVCVGGGGGGGGGLSHTLRLDYFYYLYPIIHWRMTASPTSDKMADRKFRSLVRRPHGVESVYQTKLSTSPAMIAPTSPALTEILMSMLISSRYRFLKKVIVLKNRTKPILRYHKHVAHYPLIWI